MSGTFRSTSLERCRAIFAIHNISHLPDHFRALHFTGRERCRAIFTIHNLNYGADLIGKAMDACSVATTVSPTYAQEIAGNAAVAPSLSKMFGVRNGIDMDIWDPMTDDFLPVKYGLSNFDDGKVRASAGRRSVPPTAFAGQPRSTFRTDSTVEHHLPEYCPAASACNLLSQSAWVQNAAKRALRQRMNLSDMDVPIIGVVTRLTHQKGIHLIKHGAWRALERGAQFVLLGSAPDPAVQADFQRLADDLQNQYNDRCRLCFAFDEPLSHMIYAGCDMLLVPSMFEPCGLTQMIGMRYGTVSVVRKTGGLADTVFDVDHDEQRAAEYGLEVRPSSSSDPCLLHLS